MAKDIEDAIVALQYKDADYTKVDAALAKANALKKDDYKDFSAVETAVNAVVRGKNITQQAEVDAMAKAIEDAIAALQYKDADKTTPAPAATATPAPAATALRHLLQQPHLSTPFRRPATPATLLCWLSLCLSAVVQPLEQPLLPARERTTDN